MMAEPYGHWGRSLQLAKHYATLTTQRELASHTPTRSMESPLLELETIPAPALFTLLLDHSLVDCELQAADGAVLPAHR